MSYDVRRSMRRNFIDVVLDLIGLAPYRCRSCRRLFHKRGIREMNDPTIA